MMVDKAPSPSTGAVQPPDFWTINSMNTTNPVQLTKVYSTWNVTSLQLILVPGVVPQLPKTAE